MKKLSMCLALCGVLFLAGCAAPQPEATPTLPATSTASATASATPTVTSTPLLSVTPTPDPVTSACIEIKPALPENHSYAGNLLLVDPVRGPDNRQLLHNLQTGENIILPQKYTPGHAVSPDHTQFALTDRVGNTIDIFSASGKIIKSLSMRNNWGGLATWVDNQRFAFVMYEPTDNLRYQKYPASVLILNPFTGQTRVLSPDYPNIDIANQGIRFGYWGSTVYGPTLEQVVYAGMVSDPPDPMLGSLGYILYSLTEQKILAEIPDQGPRAMPIWTADGTQLILKGSDEFYRVSAVGEVEKLTKLNPDYDIVNNSERTYFFDNFYSLSPDENHLAFWLSKEDDQDFEQLQITFTLAILDMETGEVVDTCISSGHQFYESHLVDPNPIWSPDSKSLVVSASLGEESGRNLVLVDLENMAAYQLSSDWIPTGWLLPED